MKSLSDRPPAHSEANQSKYETVIVAKQNHEQKTLSVNRNEDDFYIDGDRGDFHPLTVARSKFNFTAVGNADATGAWRTSFNQSYR